MGKHCQLRRCRRVHRYRTYPCQWISHGAKFGRLARRVIVESSLARGVRGHRDRRGNPLRLAESFIISEDKGLVLDDRASRSGPELITPELREWSIRTPGEVIP